MVSGQSVQAPSAAAKHNRRPTPARVPDKKVKQKPTLMGWLWYGAASRREALEFGRLRGQNTSTRPAHRRAR